MFFFHQEILRKDLSIYTPSFRSYFSAHEKVHGKNLSFAKIMFTMVVFVCIVRMLIYREYRNPFMSRKTNSSKK